MGRINRFIWFLIMIIIGGGAGLYYAWYVKPADFVDAALYNLRPDYKTDYVLMVAEIYDQDHNRLQALVRLDKILAPSDPGRETVVAAAIENAQILGYAPVDLQKLYRLQEGVTGERPTPTETNDPTMAYAYELTAAATPAGPDTSQQNSSPFDSSPSNESSPFAATPEVNENGVPQADADPFGTGIIITTDPNAAPQLDLPPAPMPTANSGYSSDSGGANSSLSWGD